MDGQYRKPSDVTQEFVDFLEESKAVYENARKKFEEYDSMERHIYWAHKFEFAKDRNERNRLATKYQNERKERRRYKNICDEYKILAGFINSDNNKGALKRLKGLIEVQRREEEYISNKRVYKGGD